MLESMIRAPRPTRAEATDVANAVLDGADGIMLSGETAIGRFPLEATAVAARIAEEVESRGAEYRAAQPACHHTGQGAAVAHAAAAIATGDLDVVAITCYTETGRTARLLSVERPPAPIVAKIETKPAVEHIEKILRVTDAVMVARGDLGVELPMEEIPLLQ